MQEIEVLVQVFDDKEYVDKVLSNYEFIGTKITLDIYYYNQLSSDLKFIDTKSPKNWFRIRNKDNDYFITYKKDIYDKGKWIYSDEFEIRIDNFEKGQKIIENLGLNELVRANVVKHIYKYKNYEIVFEEVENVGLFLEVEYINKDNKEFDMNNICQMKLDILFFLNSLNLDISDELNEGKPELCLRAKCLE